MTDENSLAWCGVCGKAFTVEMILGKSVTIITTTGLDSDICVHNICLQVLQLIREGIVNWEFLPAGPLRRAFQEASTVRPRKHRI